jgi:hypothetical protein
LELTNAPFVAIMSYMTNETPNAAEPEFFNLLEMDAPSALRAPLDLTAPADVLDLDMTSPGQACVDCRQSDRAINEAGRCQACVDNDASAVVPAMSHGLVTELRDIAAQGAANAAVAVAPDMNSSVGFNTSAGYIQAIRNGVPAHTRTSYLDTLQARYGMTTADLAALSLPGPMEQTALPDGAGIKHVPAGPSIFDRPAADRGFKVGDAGAMTVLKPADLTEGKLIGVVASQGHGCVIAWNGRSSMQRGALKTALEAIGAGDYLPKATSARAQAGRACDLLNRAGYVVRADRRPTTVEPGTLPVAWTSRFLIAAVNHTGGDGDEFGRVVATATLTDDTLVVTGKQSIIDEVTAEFQRRVNEEIYQSSDITSWLGTVLRKSCDAVAFGALGWYVPPAHVEFANRLCAAVQGTRWGQGWVLPGLPVTDSDHLRDGILRGLTEEIDDLMHRLATERASAKGAREAGDIGPKRAASFLADLRKIGERVVAYAVVLGDERVGAARERVRLAVADLEAVLGADHSGISARFGLIWEEIERDRKRANPGRE